MKKKEENVIKKFIYKHKKLFKYLLLFFRIAFIILIGMKYGIIGQDSHGAINHSDNLYYSWEFDTSGAIKGISTEPLLVILFISTYYAMYNYFTGINSFTLTRSKNIKQRVRNKVRYVLPAITDDLSILAIGIIFSVLVYGFTILKFNVFLVTLFKVIIVYLLYIMIPIILANSLNQYISLQFTMFILTIILFNIKGTSIFFMLLMIIIILIDLHLKCNT